VEGPSEKKEERNQQRTQGRKSPENLPEPTPTQYLRRQNSEREDPPDGSKKLDIFRGPKGNAPSGNLATGKLSMRSSPRGKAKKGSGEDVLVERNGSEGEPPIESATTRESCRGKGNFWKKGSVLAL